MRYDYDRRVIIPENEYDAMQLVGIAENIAAGRTHDMNSHVFVSWCTESGHNRLLAFSTSFHVACAMAAMRWFQANR